MAGETTSPKQEFTQLVRRYDALPLEHTETGTDGPIVEVQVDLPATDNDQAISVVLGKQYFIGTDDPALLWADQLGVSEADEQPKRLVEAYAYGIDLAETAPKLGSLIARAEVATYAPNYLYSQAVGIINAFGQSKGDYHLTPPVPIPSHEAEAGIAYEARVGIQKAKTSGTDPVLDLYLGDPTQSEIDPWVRFGVDAIIDNEGKPIKDRDTAIKLSGILIAIQNNLVNSHMLGVQSA